MKSKMIQPMNKQAIRNLEEQMWPYGYAEMFGYRNQLLIANKCIESPIYLKPRKKPNLSSFFCQYKPNLSYTRKIYSKNNNITDKNT